MANYYYKEDIATVAAGDELHHGPVVIRSITVAADVGGVAIVNFSDSADEYDSDERCFKVAISGQGTQHYQFPEGLELDNGLCVTANNGSVDVSITYN